MRRDDVLSILRAHYEILEQMGVKSLYLFGSVARDEAEPESDIDLLEEFEGGGTFNQYADVLLYLRNLLGNVELVPNDGVQERVRPYIERDAIRLI